MPGRIRSDQYDAQTLRLIKQISFRYGDETAPLPETPSVSKSQLTNSVFARQRRRDVPAGSVYAMEMRPGKQEG